jgi:hypothetical protein
MAVHASLLVARPGVDNGLVCQHGAPLIRDIENISMAFLALLILEVGIGLFAVFFVIILIDNKMKDQVLETVKGLGKKEFIGILRGRKMAIHAIGHEALGIIGVSRGLPGVVGKLNFMAGGAELRRRGSHHGVVTDTEEGKGDQNANDNKDARFEDPPPTGLGFSGRTVIVHRPSLQGFMKRTAVKDCYEDFLI